MANLTQNDAWSTTATQTSKNATYTLSTRQKFVDRDIDLKINVPGMVLNNSETFYINDGIYTWTWDIDADGNVTIY